MFSITTALYNGQDGNITWCYYIAAENDSTNTHKYEYTKKWILSQFLK